MIIELLTEYIWWDVPIDASALQPPSHDGSSASLARDLYHRLVLRLTCSTVFHRQWYFILFGAAVCGGLQLTSEAERGKLPLECIAAVAAIAGLLVPAVFMRNLVTSKVRIEAEGIIRRSFLRKLPDNLPDDLRDVWRHGWLTSDGRPLSSEICENDTDPSFASARAFWWIPSLAALGAGTMFKWEGWIGWAIVGGVALLKGLLDKNPGRVRVKELDSAAAVEGTIFVAAGGVRWAERAERARIRQEEESIRDGSRLVRFGRATGLLAARGDVFAPSAGQPFDASLRDLQTHLLVLGGTGAGKTSGVLRPIIHQVGAWADVGIVILDGKGALPAEIGDLPGFRRVDPAYSKISLVAGLEPNIIVDTIAEIFGRDNKGGDRFWRDMAALLLRSAAVIAHAAGGRNWTLQKIMTIASDAKFRKDVINLIPDERVMKDAVLGNAVIYFAREWQATEEKVRSSIVATARSWFATLTAHGDLLGWAQTCPDDEDATLDIGGALVGGRIGILVPGYRYGVAGAAVTALLKARFYNGLRKRAERTQRFEGETDVVMVIDEAQEIATDEDATMLTIGRSLGLAVVAATQTVEGVEEKLGEFVSRKWLSIYGSVVALAGRSPRTDLFVAERAGLSWRPIVQDVPGLAVRSSIQTKLVSGANAAALHQRTVGKYLDPGVFATLVELLTKWLHFWRKTGESKLAGNLSSKLGVHPVIEAGELSILLAEPDTALALMTRARVIRRDVIRLDPKYVQDAKAYSASFADDAAAPAPTKSQELRNLLSRIFFLKRRPSSLGKK